MAKLLLCLCLALAVAGASAGRWDEDIVVYGGNPTVTPIRSPATIKLNKYISWDISCPYGFYQSDRDSDIMKGRQLLDSWFAEYGRYALLQLGNTKFGCPNGAKYVTGDPFLAPAALGESKHNRVSVCVQNYVAPWDKAILFAQGNINYYCTDKRGRRTGGDLTVGLENVLGTYWASGVSGEEPGNGDGDDGLVGGGACNPARGICPVSGSNKPGATFSTIGTVKCPAGFRNIKADSEYVLIRKVLDVYYADIGRYTELNRGNVKYGCPYGAKFWDNDPFFGPAKQDPVKHFSITGCVPNKIVRGQITDVYGQGIINYYCLDRNGRKTGDVLQMGTIQVKARTVIN